MTESILGIIPPPNHQPDLAVKVPAEVLAPEHPGAPVDPAQARAVDLIFSHRTDETAGAALAARARIFVGNDSGIAHIAAAVDTPCVVIFGSSNVAHWRPWTRNKNEVVREEMSCQPCHGYFCAEFEKPQCILNVPVERVVAAIDRVMKENY